MITMKFILCPSCKSSLTTINWTDEKYSYVCLACGKKFNTGDEKKFIDLDEEELINKFIDLDEEELKKYGVDDDHWIPEDYWQGFSDALNGLISYIKEGDKDETSE